MVRGAWIRLEFRRWEFRKLLSRDSDGGNSVNRDSEGRDSEGREKTHTRTLLETEIPKAGIPKSGIPKIGIPKMGRFRDLFIQTLRRPPLTWGFAKRAFVAMTSWKCALSECEWNMVRVSQCPSSFLEKRVGVSKGSEDSRMLWLSCTV